MSNDVDYNDHECERELRAARISRRCLSMKASTSVGSSLTILTISSLKMGSTWVLMYSISTLWSKVGAGTGTGSVEDVLFIIIM